MLRAVLDTIVVLASQRGPNSAGPNREIMRRWAADEFTFLFSEDIVMEYAEKLVEHGVPDLEIRRVLANVRKTGELVRIQWFHLTTYPGDADDIAFLLCSANGLASHLVSYDDDLLVLRAAYHSEFNICQPVQFLKDLRQLGE